MATGYHDFKENHGMHVEGHGKTIDMIVSSISGTRRFREADIKILDSTEPDRVVHLSHSDNSPVQIIDGVTINIIKRGKKCGSGAVSIFYSIGVGYTYMPREYQHD